MNHFPNTEPEDDELNSINQDPTSPGGFITQPSAMMGDSVASVSSVADSHPKIPSMVPTTPNRPHSAPPVLESPIAEEQEDAAEAGSNNNNTIVLPDFLSSVSMADRDRFVLTQEVHTGKKSDGKVYSVVSGFKLDKSDENGNQAVFLINKLSHAQLRKLLGNLKIGKHWNMSKFMMRATMAKAIEAEDAINEAGLNPESNVFRKTNSLFRLTNVLFHSQRVDHFLHLNDNHTRSDHESRRTYNDFWSDAHAQYQDAEELDDEIIEIQGKDKEHILEFLSDPDQIKIKHFDNFTLPVMKMRVRDLFKTRKNVKQMMQKSGEHDNEPFNYMQLAVKDIASITVDAAYYFYMRCEEYPEIDAEFQSFMNPELKGSSEDVGPEGSATSSITGISSGGGGSRNKRKSIDRVSNDLQEYK